jgi:hypothetical protein
METKRVKKSDEKDNPSNEGAYWEQTLVQQRSAPDAKRKLYITRKYGTWTTQSLGPA